VLALDNGPHGFDPATGASEFLAHPGNGDPGHRYNDGGLPEADYGG
jgi:hypothetical protein